MPSTHALAVIMAALTILVLCSSHIEATKQWNDVDNCGKCKHKCPKAPPHSDCTCTKGKCGFKYKSPWKDCDYSKRNGCETNLKRDLRNCGRCDKRCAPMPANSKATCKERKCGFKCKDGFTLSNGACVSAACTGCVAPNNGTDAVCNLGTCEFSCRASFQNCNLGAGDPMCSDTSTDSNNCAACGQICPFSALGYFIRPCEGGLCIVPYSCDLIQGPGFGNCDGDSNTGCEENLNTSTLTSCGTCGDDSDCSSIPPFTVCSGGRCVRAPL